MLDVYFAATPNGMKIKLFLEELAERGVPLPHRLVPVRLSKGEQFRPAFLAISPNAKIPAIVDHDPPDGGEPLAMFESGAILQYLADKTGEMLSRDLRVRAQTLQWLQWQMAGLGPMAGQAGWFRVYAPQHDAFAIERYTRETGRLYGVLDRHLREGRFIAGEELSIADIACWPWIVSHAGHGQSLEDLPHLKRWFHEIEKRPATRRAFAGYEDPYAAGAGPAVATANGVAA